MPNRSNSARYLWGDRNPVNASVQWAAGGVAPHVVTNRASYTVPTAKKAIVQNMFIRMIISAAAAPAGSRYAYIKTVIAAQDYFIAWADLGADKNTVGNSYISSVGQGTQLLAGTGVFLATADSSTGGSVDYELTAIINEYDA